MRILKRAITATITLTLAGAVLAPSPAAAEYSQSPSFSWVPGGSGAVYSMAKDGDVIYIGGTFTSMRNPSSGAVEARNRLAALDANTGQLLPWNPGADNTVRSLATGPDGTVYVGGSFATVAGVPSSHLAAVTAAGTAQPGWQAGTNNTVRQIRVDGPSVFVAGEFTTVNASRRLGVAKVAAATGAVDASWNAKVSGGRVRALALSELGDLVIGGSFTTIAGRPQRFMGRVSKATGSDSGWAPVPACDNCELLDLDVDGGYIYAAMGGAGGRAAAYSPTGTTPAWSKTGDGDVQAIDAIGGTVYVGGHFGPLFLGQQRNQLVALTASSGALLPYSPSFRTNYHPGTWDLIATSSRLYVGGGFRMTTGPYARYGSFPLAS